MHASTTFAKNEGDSTLEKARHQLTLSKPIKGQRVKNILKVPVIKIKDEDEPRVSFGLFLGNYKTQKTFKHPLFEQSVYPGNFSSAVIFDVYSEFEVFDVSLQNFNVLISGVGNLSYAQTSAEVLSGKLYDSLRLTDYYYGLGPSIAIYKKYFGKKITLQFSSVFGQRIVSLVSGSNTLSTVENSRPNKKIIALKMGLNKNYTLGIQREFKEGIGLWNIGFGIKL